MLPDVWERAEIELSQSLLLLAAEDQGSERGPQTTTENSHPGPDSPHKKPFTPALAAGAFPWG